MIVCVDGMMIACYVTITSEAMIFLTILSVKCHLSGIDTTACINPLLIFVRDDSFVGSHLECSRLQASH